MSLSPGWIKLGTEPLALLDAPTGAPAWPAAFAIERTPAAPAPVPAGPALEVTAAGGPTLDAEGAASLRSAVLAAVEAVVAAEADLTAWDAVAGDGDCGPEHTDASLSAPAQAADRVCACVHRRDNEAWRGEGGGRPREP